MNLVSKIGLILVAFSCGGLLGFVLHEKNVNLNFLFILLINLGGLLQSKLFNKD